MITRKNILWVLSLIAAGALPAYANNPPQPDGLFSVLLVFPMALIGLRIARVQIPRTKRVWAVLKVALLVLSAILTAGGDEIGLVGLLVILGYGCVRGVQIIRKGTGWKRILVGTLVLLWVLFAVSDYYASLIYYPTPAYSEAAAVTALRTLVQAEDTFIRNSEISGRATNGAASLEELYQAHLIDNSFLSGQDRKGYRYGEILSPNERKFTFYALPVQYPTRALPHMIPGESLVSMFRPREILRTTAIRAFAVDETGVFRSTVRKDSSAVSEKEVKSWSEL